MRLVIAAAAVLTLAACNPATRQDAAVAAATPADGCSVVKTLIVPLTAMGAADIIEARSIAAPAGGTAPDCTDATVLLTVRRGSDKAYLHGFVSNMRRMDLIEAHAGPRYTPARIAEFLDRWSRASIAATSNAPDLTTDGISSSLPAADYDAIRARNLPMLCHYVSVHDVACLYAEPDLGGLLEPFYSQDKS